MRKQTGNSTFNSIPLGLRWITYAQEERNMITWLYDEGNSLSVITEKFSARAKGPWGTDSKQGDARTTPCLFEEAVEAWYFDRPMVTRSLPEVSVQRIRSLREAPGHHDCGEMENEKQCEKLSNSTNISVLYTLRFLVMALSLNSLQEEGAGG